MEISTVPAVTLVSVNVRVFPVPDNIPLVAEPVTEVIVMSVATRFVGAALKFRLTEGVGEPLFTVAVQVVLDTLAACCVTDTVLLILPPETVTVPVLEELPALVVTLTVTVPLLEPLVGDTVSHDVALLLAVHDTFDVTDTDVFAVADPGFHDVEPRVRFAEAGAACCVTDTVLLIPPPETVIIPLLEEAAVLAVTVTVRVPLLEPLDGDTVSQDVALLLAVHDTFDVTGTDVFAAADPGFHDVEPMVRFAEAETLVTLTV